MATRIAYQALATAALGITLSLLFGGTTSAALSNPASELLLDPPAAPSNCRARETRVPDPKWPHGYYILPYVEWRDNASNEDGFTVETWRKQSGTWVLIGSINTPANRTAVLV